MAPGRSQDALLRCCYRDSTLTAHKVGGTWALARLYQDCIETLLRPCCDSIQALLRLYDGASVQALLRLYEDSVKALLRFYSGAFKAL